MDAPLLDDLRDMNHFPSFDHLNFGDEALFDNLMDRWYLYDVLPRLTRHQLVVIRACDNSRAFFCG